MNRTGSRFVATLLACTALTSPALAADQRALEDKVQQQQQEIDALKKQVQDLVSIVNQRVTKVETATENGKVIFNQNSPRIEGPNSDYSLQFVGNLQVTAGFYDQHDSGPRALTLNNGVQVRRAQVGIQGTAFRDFTYASV